MPEKASTDQAGAIYHAADTQKRPVYPYQSPSSSAVYGYTCVQPGKQHIPATSQVLKRTPKPEKKEKSTKD
jgi:hypothetical protein